QPLGVGGHDPVLDSVVHHLDEVARAVWSAMEIAVFGGAGGGLLAPGRPRRGIDRRRERGEQRVEMSNDLRLAADHLAEAAFETPYAAAGTRIHVVDAQDGQHLCAPDVV